MATERCGITILAETHNIPSIMDEELRIIREQEPDHVLHEGWGAHDAETMDAAMNATRAWHSKQAIEDYFAEQYDIDIFPGVEQDAWVDTVTDRIPFGGYLRPEVKALTVPTLVEEDRPAHLPDAIRRELQDAADDALTAAGADGQETALERDATALHHYLELDGDPRDATYRFVRELAAYYEEMDVSYAGCDIDTTGIFEAVYEHDTPAERTREFSRQLAGHNRRREAAMARSMTEAAEDGDVLAVVGSNHVREHGTLRRILDAREADYNVVRLDDAGHLERVTWLPHAAQYEEAMVGKQATERFERKQASDAFKEAAATAPVGVYDVQA